MAARVLGMSGSPIPNSNTDRAVHHILAHTGLDLEFVKLSDLTIEPCRACLGCVKTNRCVVKDDGQMLAEKFRQADAFVLGGYTPYSSLDARTKAFMERMYCPRHREGLNCGKVGVAVITTACPPNSRKLPPAAKTALSQIRFWMMEEGMVDLGSMVILGNVPCLRCGYGDQCELSGIKMMHGPDATMQSIRIRSFEEDTSPVREAAALGNKIRTAVLSGRAG